MLRVALGAGADNHGMGNRRGGPVLDSGSQLVAGFRFGDGNRGLVLSAGPQGAGVAQAVLVGDAALHAAAEQRLIYARPAAHVVEGKAVLDSFHRDGTTLVTLDGRHA